AVAHRPSRFRRRSRTSPADYQITNTYPVNRHRGYVPGRMKPVLLRCFQFRTPRRGPSGRVRDGSDGATRRVHVSLVALPRWWRCRSSSWSSSPRMHALPHRHQPQPPRLARAGRSARRGPAVLAPTALAFLAAIADDRVPVAVRLFLILRRDLEGKGLAVLERRAAVETETGNAQNGELHRQHIALLAARVVTGRLVNSGHFTIRKGGGVEARRLMRVLVEPEADRVLWLHVRVLL